MAYEIRLGSQLRSRQWPSPWRLRRRTGDHAQASRPRRHASTGRNDVFLGFPLVRKETPGRANGCAPPVYAYGKFIGQDPDPNVRLKAARQSRRRRSVANRRLSASYRSRLMRARDAEGDRFFQRLLDLRRRHQRQRVAGDGAVMAGAADRVLDARDAWSSARCACRDRRRGCRPCRACGSRRRARSSVPRRNDSTTGSVILPSRKSSPTFLPSLADLPP